MPAHWEMPIYTYERYAPDGRFYLGTIEPEIEWEFDQYGSGGLIITGMFLREEGGGGWLDMGKSSSLTVRALVDEIARAIYADENWCNAQLADAGYTYVTRGGTDPSAHWERDGKRV